MVGPSHSSYWKQRPCKYFTRDGSPIDGGCFRTAPACKFIHPEEDGWLRKADKRRRSPITSPRDSDFRGSLWSRSPTPPYRSRPRRDSNASSTSKDVQKPSTQKVPLAARLSKLPADPADSFTLASQQQSMPSVLPTPPATSTSGEPLQDQQQQKPSLPPIFTESQAEGPSSAISVASETRLPTARPSSPPQPQNAPPVQPPPPLPYASQFMTIEPSTPALELSPEMLDLRTAWLKRIQTMADSIKVRDRQTKLEEDLAFTQSITQRESFNSLPEDMKRFYLAQISDLELQRDKLKDEADGLLAKLVESNSWPISPEELEAEEKLEEGYKSLATYVAELKNATEEMNKLLCDMGGIKPPPIPEHLRGGASGEEGELMDVDGDGPPTKRQRLDPPEKEKEATPVQPPSQKELDEIFDRIKQIENMLNGYENEMNQHDRDLREEFNDIVENKFQELKATLAEGFEAPVEFLEGEEGYGVDEELATLVGEVSLAGEQVGELALDVADLITKSDEIEKELAIARKEHTESLSKYEAINQRLQTYESAREENARRLTTLENALKAHMSRPPSPPASPRMPNSSYLLQAIEEPITDALREAVRPVLEEFRDGVKGKLEVQSKDIYDTLWNKVDVTVGLLDSIRSQFGKQAEAGVVGTAPAVPLS